jgi:hypothetical protein
MGYRRDAPGATHDFGATAPCHATTIHIESIAEGPSDRPVRAARPFNETMARTPTSNTSPTIDYKKCSPPPALPAAANASS